MKLNLLALLLLLSQSGCFLPYVIKQGYYQTVLLRGARPVEDVILNPELTENDKQKLLLITVLKRFSMAHMKMPESKNYTTINPTWNHDLNVVSASKELAFEPYLWSFPIIGQVPYLGFFDKDDAASEDERLKKEGYDTMLRQVAAYSSIGYFNDPIWPQMLQRSEHSLSDLVLHELAHSTVYFKNQSDFNESFANFVGKVGALQFMQANYGSHSMELFDAILTNEDELRFGAWINEVYDRLQEVYTRVRDDESKRKLKADEIERAKRSFRRIEFRSQAYRRIEVPEINNAFLLMYRRYNTSQSDFEKLYVGLGSDWHAFFKTLESLRSEDDLFAALRKLSARYDYGES